MEIRNFSIEAKIDHKVHRKLKYRKLSDEGKVINVFCKRKYAAIFIDACFTAVTPIEERGFVVNGIYSDEKGFKWICTKAGEIPGAKELDNYGNFRNLYQYGETVSGPPTLLNLYSQAIPE